MYIASTLGEVDKMAVPQFEEHKLCLPASLAQFQIVNIVFLFQIQFQKKINGLASIAQALSAKQSRPVSDYTEGEVQLLQALLFNNNDKNAERKSGVAPKQGQ